jgi:hypothetical protein
MMDLQGNASLGCRHMSNGLKCNGAMIGCDMSKAMAAFLAAGFALEACTGAPRPAETAQTAPSSSVPIVSAPKAVAQSTTPWRHLPNPVSDQKFQLDNAKCEKMGKMAPVGAGSSDFKAYIVFTECMRTEGYVSVPPAK